MQVPRAGAELASARRPAPAAASRADGDARRSGARPRPRGHSARTPRPKASKPDAMTEFEQRVAHRRRACARPPATWPRRAPPSRSWRRAGRSSRTRIPIRTGARSAPAPSRGLPPVDVADFVARPRSRGDRGAGCRRRPGASRRASRARAPVARPAGARRRARRIAARPARAAPCADQIRRRHSSITDCEHGVRVEAVELALEPQQDAVAQHGDGDGLEVVDVDVRAAGHHGAHARGAHQRLQRARARAVAHVPARRGGLRRRRPAAWRATRLDGRLLAALAEQHRAAQPRRCAARRPGPRWPRACRRARASSDTSSMRAQRFAGRERHLELEHEAVQLRLGQRVGAFELDRILRRQHAERSWAAGEQAPACVTCLSCMASSSAACVRGVARLISSTSTQLGEDRARVGTRSSTRRRATSCRSRAPVTSAGIRSGVHCTRAQLQPERRRERLGEVRLAEPGQALDQHVAAGEDGGDQVGDERLLAHDDAVEQRTHLEQALLRVREAEIVRRHGAHDAPPGLRVTASAHAAT